MELIPIKKELEENGEFATEPLTLETIRMTIDFYKKVGFVPPWIGYFAKLEGELVGSAGFKGKPVNGTVEIAYGTFEKYRKKGIGSVICKQLVELSLKTNPLVRITARTLPEKSFSSRILDKNDFFCIGIVNDPEDGEVWEWEFRG
jgi:ribosomal-protein-alanine N-acetyltransferase